MLAAGDTFRAAAIEQLKIWAGRAGADIVAREPGGDAASLAFEALTRAKATDADVLLIDTAGRLQNRAELMNELEKIVRVIKKVDAEAPHATLLALDATVGQNALSQVEIFGRIAGVTGLVMTKLDGTARGGILVAVAEKFGLPVHFIGVGEGVDDLEPFAARDFAAAIAGVESGEIHERGPQQSGVMAGHDVSSVDRGWPDARHERRTQLTARRRARRSTRGSSSRSKSGRWRCSFTANAKPALFGWLVSGFLPQALPPERSAC